MKHHFLHADSPVIRVAYEQSARCQDPSWKPYADSAKHMCGSYEPITHSQSFRPLPAPCILRVNTFCRVMMMSSKEKKGATAGEGGVGRVRQFASFQKGDTLAWDRRQSPRRRRPNSGPR